MLIVGRIFTGISQMIRYRPSLILRVKERESARGEVFSHKVTFSHKVFKLLYKLFNEDI